MPVQSGVCAQYFFRDRFPSATLLGVLAALLGCNVEAVENTGGTDSPAGSCGRGVVVVNTDYQSTNVSLVSVDGAVLSRSFFSSASTATGLSAPLGGDVVLPTQAQGSNTIVLLDRYPASVITWVDVASASPVGQLSVATGFAANPRDYWLVSPNKAYVTRYDPNLDPGRQPMDEGSDVLIVNPEAREVAGRIDMTPTLTTEAAGYYPRPDKLLGIDTEGFRGVLVLLGGYSADFLSSAASRVAWLDPDRDSLEQTLVLEGMHGCTAMALSPSGHRVAIACSGEFAGDSVTTLAESGIVILSVDGDVKETRRFPAAKFGQGPVGGTVAYTSDTQIVFTTFGQFDDKGESLRQDALVQLDIETGDFKELLYSDGRPFTLGDVRCTPTCGLCYVADAERSGGVIHRFVIEEDGGLGARLQIVVDRTIGLPPRNLGWF